jgi:nudix-type nucleoside diphosphatase (YffH/AdpP family)
MQKASIINKQVLSKRWAEFSLYTLSYTREDGKSEIILREMMDSGHGVAILLYNLSTRKIILVEQFRLAAYLGGDGNGMMKEVCAGLVGNESPRETVIREVQEEVGLHIEDVEFLFSAYASPGAKS